MTKKITLFILILQVFSVTICFGETQKNKSSKYIDLLKEELNWYIEMKDYETIKEIIYDELDNNLLQGVPLLRYVVENKPLFNYMKEEGNMSVIFDNSFHWSTRITEGNKPPVIIPPYTCKKIELTPGNHEITVFCKHLNYLETIIVPAISPPSDNCHLIYNIGKRNSYRIVKFHNRRVLRKDNDECKGWPRLLRKPESIWISCTELFPKKNEKLRFSNKAFRKKASITSLFRLSAKDYDY